MIKKDVIEKARLMCIYLAKNFCIDGNIEEAVITQNIISKDTGEDLGRYSITISKIL